MKLRYVIDMNGNYITYVMLISQGDKIVPFNYTLKPGERLLDAHAPVNMIKPRWIGSEWEETASPEEIAAAAPTVSEPALDPITELQLAIAELYEEVLSRG